MLPHIPPAAHLYVEQIAEKEAWNDHTHFYDYHHGNQNKYNCRKEERLSCYSYSDGLHSILHPPSIGISQ